MEKYRFNKLSFIFQRVAGHGIWGAPCWSLEGPQGLLDLLPSLPALSLGDR